MANRNTIQKEKIKESFRYLKHPTATEVFEYVSQYIPNISMGTVYRNLNNFVEANELKLVILDDNIERFDSCLDLHHHMICEKCNKIVDINYNIDDTIQDIELKNNVKINDYTIILKGLCNKCK